MRTCFNCNGKGKVVWCDDEPPTTCTVCEGTGECEDVCYCAAREPFECSCGGVVGATLISMIGMGKGVTTNANLNS